METAYLKISDAREMKAQSLSNSTTKSVLSPSGGKAAQGSESKVITVHFNPSTLKFDAGSPEKSGERTGVDHKDDGSKEHTDSSVVDSNVSVSMELIFDRSIYKDSSVQPEVESFLAMVKNPYIRKVEFFWGKMYYRGVVDGVDAEYTLFNNQGDPTRAKVNLKIHIDNKL